MGKNNFNKNADYFLWESLKNGDKRALSEIYHSHYALLYNYGLRIYHNPDFIKDCIQELFFGLISKLDSLGATDNIRFYLLASFRRKVFEKLKKSSVLNYSDSENPSYDVSLDDSPEEKLIHKETDDQNHQHIDNMLNRLSAREREIIYLKYYKNLTYKEIMEIMKVNYESARKMVYRAIKSLRSMYQKADL